MREGDEDWSYLECPECGRELPAPRTNDKYYFDGDQLTCDDCGAVSVVSVDEESEPYVGSWKCKHGRWDEEPCVDCEVENGIAV